MLHPAERGALHRRVSRVEGIDLDHPAEAVRLVPMDGRVEARVELEPAVAGAGGRVDPVARHVRGDGSRPVDEVVVEVLFAGQVRTPGRVAVRAVVHGAEDRRPRGIRGRLHRRIARGRTRDAHRGVGGDAPGVLRGPHHAPLAVLVHHLDDRDPVGGLRLPDLVRRPVGGGVPEQQPVVDVFVVHHQEAAVVVGGAVGQREEVHAVVMHAGLLLLVHPRVEGLVVPLGPVRDGISPGVEDLGRIPAGDDHPVFPGQGNAREAQEGGSPRLRQELPGAAHHCDGEGPQPALDELASRQGEDLLERRVGRRVAGNRRSRLVSWRGHPPGKLRRANATGPMRRPSNRFVTMR